MKQHRLACIRESLASRIIIRFKDGGTPFNPLAQDMPDTTLSWKLRRMGGLGIFLVIKKMDAVSYAYTDHQNVLTIEKKV
jgi:anti-sigma regulatory factor (Ser/Thr protein kinase)